MKWDWSKPYPFRSIEGGKSVKDAVVEMYEECAAEEYVCAVSTFLAMGATGDRYAIPVVTTDGGVKRLMVMPDRYCPPFQVWPLILTEEEKLRKRVHELEHKLQTIADMATAAVRS